MSAFPSFVITLSHPMGGMSSVLSSAGAEGNGPMAHTLARLLLALPISRMQMRCPGGIVTTCALSSSSLSLKMAPFRPTTTYSSPTTADTDSIGGVCSSPCETEARVAPAELGMPVAGTASSRLGFGCNADVNRDAQWPCELPVNFSLASSSSSNLSCCSKDSSLSRTFSKTKADVSSLEASGSPPLEAAVTSARCVSVTSISTGISTSVTGFTSIIAFWTLAARCGSIRAALLALFFLHVSGSCPSGTPPSTACL
mmetsp:Transcript_23254/g.53523  ORF Transcript_23254/g.53523 Transcript_23254/m.53523 type:complete len:256 (-) Transcript_23254:231-998(-)